MLFCFVNFRREESIESNKQMNSYKEKLLNKYIGSISDISDLTAGEKPSALFYLLIYCLGYLLSNDAEKTGTNSLYL